MAPNKVRQELFPFFFFSYFFPPTLFVSLKGKQYSSSPHTTANTMANPQTTLIPLPNFSDSKSQTENKKSKKFIE
jgi:hypothetical protein